jgi:hypothetical protein
MPPIVPGRGNAVTRISGAASEHLHALAEVLKADRVVASIPAGGL